MFLPRFDIFRALLEYTLALRKVIRIPESNKFSLVESGILGSGIWNPTLRIQNPAKDWNPESKLLKIHSKSGWLESGIQYLESEIHSMESRIHDCLGLPYMGRNSIWEFLR